MPSASVPRSACQEDRTQTRRGEAYVDIVEMARFVERCLLGPRTDRRDQPPKPRAPFPGSIPDVVLYDAMAM